MVIIVSVTETALRHAPHLEDHRLVSIIRHPQLEVASGEGETRRPEGLQLGHRLDTGLLFWLCTVPQIARRHHAFKITVGNSREYYILHSHIWYISSIKLQLKFLCRAFIVPVTHDWACVACAITFRCEGSLHIRQVRTTQKGT